MSIPTSVSLFVLAGLCEIGGGYLVWLSLREGKPLGYALVGSLIPYPLWNYSHLPAGPLRTGVCRLWRSVYRALAALGMGPRRHEAGSIRRDRHDHLSRRNGGDHV